MPELTSSTVETNVLKVKIILDDGKSVTYNIQNPVANLTKNDVANASDDQGFAGYIVSENLLNVDDGAQAVDVGDAYYYQTQKIIFD